MTLCKAIINKWFWTMWNLTSFEIAAHRCIYVCLSLFACLSV